ncbi:MAG: heavy-metal-associated domain-containing protein [Gaiellales bacterium]
MADVSEVINVTGFRCERCVARLAAVLEGHPGLHSAYGNLLGEVTVSYDDALTSRADLLTAMARGGFHELTVSTAE